MIPFWEHPPISVMMRRWRRLVIVGGEVSAAEAAWFLLVVFVTLVSSAEGRCRTSPVRKLSFDMAAAKAD